MLCKCIKNALENHLIFESDFAIGEEKEPKHRYFIWQVENGKATKTLASFRYCPWCGEKIEFDHI